jgi:DNA-binding IclR family transcriptional regulator
MLTLNYGTLSHFMGHYLKIMSRPSSTLERAILLLDCFTQDQPYLGVREAARISGLSSSTAGRILASLKDLNLLIQDTETHKYALAGKVLAWAEVYGATLDVRKLAQPFIFDLQRLTGETISLYVQEGTNRVCVERVESNQNVRVVARVGRYIPLYAGSAGKLFLAYLTEEEREAFLDVATLEPLTPYTITNAEELREQAIVIKNQGYAISHREWTIDASGIAAPIFNQRGQVVAALTVSGPTQRFFQENLERFTAACTRTASQISRLLGFNPGRQKIGLQQRR